MSDQNYDKLFGAYNGPSNDAALGIQLRIAHALEYIAAQIGKMAGAGEDAKDPGPKQPSTPRIRPLA